mmetsp:Transcript_26150/g.29951  ORF Transcript_26150/g.29951 Transcript_26150/m.29951 type:complete len:86 (+) Transcript_26150:226-483(+)
MVVQKNRSGFEKKNQIFRFGRNTKGVEAQDESCQDGMKTRKSKEGGRDERSEGKLNLGNESPLQLFADTFSVNNCLRTLIFSRAL